MDPDESLLDELSVLEQQPLEHRAAAYIRIHDALTDTLHAPGSEDRAGQ